MTEDEAIGLRAALAVAMRERDEAREDAHYATGVAKLAMKHRDMAEAELDTVRKALHAALTDILTLIEKE